MEKELFQDSALRSLAATTQAIDIIRGGVKVNALPERAWAVVNHRIAVDSKDLLNLRTKPVFQLTHLP